jgi:hypothetical protein
MYQKLLNILKKHTDKVFHFTAGMGIYLLTVIWLPIWIAAIAVFVASLGKEIYDQIAYKGFDWIDLVATLAGGAFVFACMYLG